MAIDPVRLARIRARLVAAAAITLPACGGGVPEHVNEPRKDPQQINQAPLGDSPKPDDGPINERPAPVPEHVNTPPPETAVAPQPDGMHVNRPKPDSQPTKPPTVNDIPNPGQTINTVPTKPPTKIYVNTPPPDRPAPPSQIP